jgi:hypothetical protein
MKIPQVNTTRQTLRLMTDAGIRNVLQTLCLS